MRRATDLFRIKGERTILEGGKRRLDFAVPLIDVVGNLIGFRIGFLEAVHAAAQTVLVAVLARAEVAVAADPEAAQRFSAKLATPGTHFRI